MSLIFECLFIVLILLGGYVFLWFCGVSRNARIVFALTAGLSIYLAVVYLQIVSLIPTYPLVSIAIFALLAIGLLYRGRHSIAISRIEVVYLAIAVGVILVVVFACNNISLVKYHFDSLRYLLVGSLLASNNLDALSTNLLLKRLSSVAILNSPAHVSGNFYFPGLLPVVGINLLVVMFYLVFAGVRQIAQAWGAYLVAGASVILLLSINRTVWNGFYLNDHLLEALFLLTVVGAGWLGALRALPTNVSSVVQAVAIVGAVMSRPEGFIMVGLALAPTLLSEDVPGKRRAQLACVWGVSVILQQAAVFLGFMGLGLHLPSVAVKTFALGVAILVFSPALHLTWITRHARGILVAAELGLWLMLAILVASDSQIFYKSLHATLGNVVQGRGGWGVSIMVLAGLVVAVGILTNAPARMFVRFPVTSFAPVAFIFAYLRDEPYRIGLIDSLNRMFFHVVPIAILLVASAATSQGIWRQREKAQSS